MAYLLTWFQTKLPSSVCESFLTELSPVEDTSLKHSNLSGGRLDPKIRTSRNFFVSSNSWMAGFLWHYVQKANGENFCYDITGFQDGTLQYGVYREGDFYTWHQDAGLGSVERVENPNFEGFSNGEVTRKLSVVLQLSNPADYEGGELQLFDPVAPREKLLEVPREQGTVIVFDSRVPHRVRKIRSGTRRSVVGWVTGPRWR